MTLLELARILACVVAMLGLSGAGLTLLLVRDGTARWALLVTPFVGLAVTCSVAYLTSSLGLPAARSIWLLGALALLLLALGRRARDAAPQPPRGAPWAIVLAALPALLLAVWPMVAIDRLLPIGDSNCDPMSYAAVTDFLRDGSLRQPPEVKRVYPTTATVAFRMKTQERLGFEMIAAYTDILAGERAALRTFSAIAGAGFALGAIGAGVVAAAGLGGGLAAGVAATLLYALCAFPLWVAYGGYGPQALASGLIPLTLWVGACALRSGAWRDRALAGVLVSGVAGVYSESLPYVAAPLALLALAELWRQRGAEHTWRPLAGLLAIGVVAVAFDPIAAARAVDRVWFAVATPNRGNVDWHTDLRQVLGLLPFTPVAPGTSPLPWVPFLLLCGFVALGCARLDGGGRRLALAFAAPALLSIAWFVRREFPYGEFKAWSIAAFLPFSLLGLGLVASWAWSAQRRVARRAVLVAALLAIAPIAAQSVQLARAMATRFAFSPALDEVSAWLGAIADGQRIFVASGKLSSVSTAWIAYVLRAQRVRADTGICYSRFGKDTYDGEPWVLRHRSSDLLRDAAPAPRVVAANAEFELLRIE